MNLSIDKELFLFVNSRKYVVNWSFSVSLRLFFNKNMFIIQNIYINIFYKYVKFSHYNYGCR